MKSMLSKLYGREISPFESTYPKDPEYPIERDKYYEMMQQLQDRLSENDFNQVEKTIRQYALISSMECEQSFYVGFELGSMLMIDVYTDKAGLFAERTI